MQLLNITKELAKLAKQALFYTAMTLGVWLLLGLIGIAFENAPGWSTPIATFTLIWGMAFLILCMRRFA